GARCKVQAQEWSTDPSGCAAVTPAASSCRPTFTQPGDRASKASYASTIRSKGTCWLISADGSTVPDRTICSSFGRYFRCGQFPAFKVKFLFMSSPMGKTFELTGYTPMIASVPAFARESSSQRSACDGALPGTH